MGTQQRYRVHGLDCAEEVAVLKRELGPLVGGEQRLSFDVLQGRLTVSPQASDVEPRQVIDAVARTGMRAEPWRETSSEQTGQRGWQRWGRPSLTALSGVAILVAVATHAWLAGNVATPFAADVAPVPWAVRAVYALAIVSGAW